MFVRFALVALALAGNQQAFAQGASDPKLCSSINGILENAPTGAWPDKPNVTLEWDGGSAPCVTKGGVLVCAFYDMQMASGDLCKLFKDEPAEERTRNIAGRTYAQTRAIPTLQACMSDSQASDWSVQEPNRVSQGYTIMPPGKSTFHFGETNSRLELAGSICAFNSLGLEFDPKK